jgi:hypothetical protein
MIGFLVMTKRELVFYIVLWLGLIPMFAIFDLLDEKYGVWVGLAASGLFFAIYRLCLDFIFSKKDD